MCCVRKHAQLLRHEHTAVESHPRKIPTPDTAGCANRGLRQLPACYLDEAVAFGY